MSAPTIPGFFDYDYDDSYPEDLYAYKGVLPTIEGFASFDDAAMARYREAGVVAIERAFPPAMCEATLAALQDIVVRDDLPAGVQLQFEHRAKDVIATVPPEERLDYVRKFMLFMHLDSRLEAMAFYEPLLNVLRRILGDEPDMFQDMALLKPPRLGREKPWHQDNAYFNVAAGTPVVGFWLALDEATPENGCMFFQPGRQKEGPIPHFNRRDWQICDTDVVGRGVLAAPLGPGGCLIFDGMVPHGTPSNRSGRRRRALQCHYKPASVPMATAEERLAQFGSEGKNVVC